MPEGPKEKPLLPPQEGQRLLRSVFYAIPAVSVADEAGYAILDQEEISLDDIISGEGLKKALTLRNEKARKKQLIAEKQADLTKALESTDTITNSCRSYLGNTFSTLLMHGIDRDNPDDPNVQLSQALGLTEENFLSEGIFSREEAAVAGIEEKLYRIREHTFMDMTEQGTTISLQEQDETTQAQEPYAPDILAQEQKQLGEWAHEYEVKFGKPLGADPSTTA